MLRKIRFYEKLAQAWTDSGVDWAVCNGLANYPEDIGRDLDIVTTRADLRSALETTIRVMTEEGFTPMSFRLGWIYWTVGFRWHEGKIESVQIDLFDHLQWAFCRVVDEPGRFGNVTMRGPFREDPAANVGKRLVLNALSGNFSTFEKKPHYLQLTEAEDKVLPQLVEHLAGQKCDSVIEAIRSGDSRKISAEMDGYRKRVMRRALTPGLGWARRMFGAFQKQWEINLFPRRAVPIVAVQSLHEELEQQVVDRFMDRVGDELVFCAKKICRNRPNRIFKGEGKSAWMILADYLLGDRLWMRRQSALQVLQCFQGHALALSLDPSREGLKKFPIWMARTVRQPDLDFLVLKDESERSTVASNRTHHVFVGGTGDQLFEAFIDELEQISERQRLRLQLTSYA